MPGRAPSTKKKRKKKRKTEAVLIFSPSRYLIMIHKRKVYIFAASKIQTGEVCKRLYQNKWGRVRSPIKKTMK